MSADKILSSLSYFSLFFAPFLFPLIVYFLTEHETKRHAKRAFISHIIPLVLIVLAMIIIIIVDVNSVETSPIFLILWMIVTAIITLVMYIWNIIQGIKVLIN